MNMTRTLSTVALSLLPLFANAHPSHADNAQHFLEHALIAALLAVPGFFLVRRLSPKRQAIRIRKD
ncbi:MAG: hypothetical protein H6981_11420 [Gammaproteobacteria bacterium]|nr:hypothetical protein [Gammaproteobacteria bacterium]MCP5137396.1 hypothetical protein [Gammaproteobacteria bacterium]